MQKLGGGDLRARPSVEDRELEVRLRRAREENRALEDENRELASKLGEVQGRNQDLVGDRGGLREFLDDTQRAAAELHGRVDALQQDHEQVLARLDGLALLLEREGLRASPLSPGRDATSHWQGLYDALRTWACDGETIYQLDLFLRQTRAIEEELGLLIQVAEVLRSPRPAFEDPELAGALRGHQDGGGPGAGEHWFARLGQGECRQIRACERALKRALFGEMSVLARARDCRALDARAEASGLDGPVTSLETDALRRLFRTDPDTGAPDVTQLRKVFVHRVAVPVLSGAAYLLFACPIERAGDVRRGLSAVQALLDVLATRRKILSPDVELCVPQGFGEQSLSGPIPVEQRAAAANRYHSAVAEALAVFGWKAYLPLPYLTHRDEVRERARERLSEAEIEAVDPGALTDSPGVLRLAAVDAVARVDVPLLFSTDRGHVVAPRCRVITMGLPAQAEGEPEERRPEE